MVVLLSCIFYIGLIYWNYQNIIDSLYDENTPRIVVNVLFILYAIFKIISTVKGASV